MSCDLFPSRRWWMSQRRVRCLEAWLVWRDSLKTRSLPPHLIPASPSCNSSRDPSRWEPQGLRSAKKWFENVLLISKSLTWGIRVGQAEEGTMNVALSSRAWTKCQNELRVQDGAGTRQRKVNAGLPWIPRLCSFRRSGFIGCTRAPLNTKFYMEIWEGKLMLHQVQHCWFYIKKAYTL